MNFFITSGPGPTEAYWKNKQKIIIKRNIKFHMITDRRSNERTDGRTCGQMDGHTEW